MDGQKKTPMDQLAGLPLPLVPINQGDSPDWHHHFHPRTDPLLEDIGGRAVRAVRLQKANYRMHHIGYHGTYGGPALPETEEEKFGTVIMAAAGYIPEYGIAFGNNYKAKRQKLTVEQRHHLQTSGDLRIGTVDPVRRFLRHHILNQSIEALNLNELTIEEFVTTKDGERRRLLGHNILGIITDKATESVDETYWQANRQGLLQPGLPNNVQRFAKTKLGTTRNRAGLVTELHTKLAA